jgi:predicted acetyltransferase
MATIEECQLIEPRADLEASHKTFVAEFQARGEPIVPWVVGLTYPSFEDYLGMLGRAAQGIGLRQGVVPHSTYWLINDSQQIVAISNLRHDLTNDLLKHGGHIGYGVRPSSRRQGYGTEVLRQTMIQALQIGITRARMTCDKDNIASARTILRNGGILDEEEFMPEHGHVVSRYWINI